MNPREKTLLVILLTLLAGLGGTFLLVRYLITPLREYDKKIAALQKEVDDKTGQFEEMLREKKKLERFRLLALGNDNGKSLNSGQAVANYTAHFKRIMTDSGLSWEKDSFRVALPPERTQTDKKAVEQIMKIQVDKVQTTWPSLVQFLDQFERQLYLHRIHDLTIDQTESTPGPDSKLAVKLAVEVLMAPLEIRNNSWAFSYETMRFDILSALGQGMTGWTMLARGLALAAEPPKRSFADLSKKNPFVGALPPPGPPPLPPPPEITLLKPAGKELELPNPELNLVFRVKSALPLKKVEVRADKFPLFKADLTTLKPKSKGIYEINTGKLALKYGSNNLKVEAVNARGPGSATLAVSVPPLDASILENYKLSLISSSAGQAIFINHLYSPSEEGRKHTVGTAEGYNVFKVREFISDDRFGRVVLDAKVLHVGHRDLYFQTQGKVYGIHLEENLAQAMQKPLSPKQLEKLGLETPGTQKKVEKPEPKTPAGP